MENVSRVWCGSTKHVYRSCPLPLTAVLLFLLSFSRNHLSPAGPPRVGVLPRHLRLSSSQSGSVLGQTLPAAAWGAGADCQESGHLECWRGPTRSHTVSAHEKQTRCSFTHSNRKTSSSNKWIIQGAPLWSTRFRHLCINMPLGWMSAALIICCFCSSGGRFRQRTPRM